MGDLNIELTCVIVKVYTRTNSGGRECNNLKRHRKESKRNTIKS